MVRILLIEDEKNIRESIEEILTLNGYEVISAQDGKSGYLKAINIKPDLIICDIMMPNMDGYEVLSQIRETKSIATSAFIFLTALSQRENRRKGVNLGADDYITKPFKIDELLKSIESRLLRKFSTEKAAIIEEQKRYAKDLHDGLQQRLLGIKYAIVGLEKQLKNKNSKIEIYDKLKQQLEVAILEARHIAYNNSPQSFLKESLFESIERLCNELIIDNIIRFDFKPTLSFRLDKNLESALFRIVQECISNILKHAEASLVTISLSQERRKINLIIEDNGKGMKKESLLGGQGLKNIQARLEQFNGKLKIDSKLGIGTTIFITI